MTMISPELCPQNLADRSASFNRAEFNRTMRTKASNTDSTFDVESLENLSVMNVSARHVRHSSLDSSNASALHPINLNSKFENMFSSIWPAKGLAKISVDQADRENPVSSAPDKEGGTETQEELILEPHESLFQDAQEESFSTSMSAESKSPREDMNFILWGNAAFCLSEGRDLLPGSKALGLYRQTDGSYGDTKKKQNSLLSDKSHHHAHSSEESPCSPASNRSCLLPSSNAAQDEHAVLSARNNAISAYTADVNSVCQTAESLKCQSSVGSTHSVSNFTAQRHGRTQNLADSALQKSSISSEAQNCCPNSASQHIEASLFSACKTPAYVLQETCSGKQEDHGNMEEVSNCSQPASQVGGAAPCQVHNVKQHDASIASEEVKIRAELELEIEKDLEQELRTKIYLLSRRLEELNALKANRHLKPEHDETQIDASSCMPLIPKEGALVVKEAPSVISSSSTCLKNRALFEQRGSILHVDMPSARKYLASSKKQLQDLENDGHLNDNIAPFASWRTLAMASGLAPHLKESDQQPSVADRGLQNNKVSKNSTEGVASGNTKLQLENMPRFQQDFQNWTGNSSAKRFDWIRTLRSDASGTARVVSMKKGTEEASPFLPTAKETIHGNVSTTLFSEDSSSAPLKKKPVKTEKRERPMTPTAGNSKRSAFSSAKTSGDVLPSTPRIRKTSSGPITVDNVIASVPTKRITSQKPVASNNVPGPLPQKIPDSRQGRITTPSNPQAPTQQASSGKVEKINAADNSLLSSRPLKTMPPTHAEKIMRSTSAPPGVRGRSVNSKDGKSVLTNCKQGGSLQQTKISRIASTPKPGTPSSQIRKASAVVHSESVIKKSGLTLAKPTGVTRGKWY